MTAAALLTELRRRGLGLTLRGGRVVIHGRRRDLLGVREEIKRRSSELASLLRAERGTPILPGDLPGIMERLGGPATPCLWHREMASKARQDGVLGAPRRLAEAEAERVRAKAARRGLSDGSMHTFDCHECGKDGRSPVVVSTEQSAHCPRCGRAMVRNSSPAALSHRRLAPDPALPWDRAIWRLACGMADTVIEPSPPSGGDGSEGSV
jgi:hypothetical protein